MKVLCYWFVAFILLNVGCTGLRTPKTKIDRTMGSYEENLTQLRDYLADMPVDVVVTGYTPKLDTATKHRVSLDSSETLLQDVVIKQMDPLYTLVRSNSSSDSESIRIPTQHVTRISAFGMRKTLAPQGSWNSGYTTAIILGVLALIFTIRTLTASDGCLQGCYFLVALAATSAAVFIALTGYLITTNSDDLVERQESVSETFVIE
jgi:hypothetical protein